MRESKPADHTGKAVITDRDIEGTLVDVVECVWFTEDDKPVIVRWAVLRSGTYTIEPAYRTDESAIGTRIKDAEGRFAEPIATSDKDSTTALANARRILREGALIDKHAAAARKVTKTLTVDDFAALPQGAELQVGDVVGINGHGKFRVGIVIQAGPRNATFIFATPSSGRVSKGTGRRGTDVRLIRRPDTSPEEKP